MDKNTNSFTMMFATGMCVVLAIALAGTYEALKANIRENELYDQQVSVLIATGLHTKDPSSPPKTRAELEALFAKYVDAKVLEVVRGKVTETVKRAGEERAIEVEKVVDLIPTEYSVKDLAQLRLEQSRKPPAQRKEYAPFFKRVDDQGDAVAYCIPIDGIGLWGEMFGYLALQADKKSVQGITFYKHKETPGLGGEVDNLGWQAQWQGKQVYEDGHLLGVIVKKGKVDDSVPREKAHMVDGLSGATITSNAVTRFVREDLEKYESYLDKL